MTHGWCTSERETDSGVESRQWIGLENGVVTADEEGARQLGQRYLDEVQSCTYGLVRWKARTSGIALMVAGVIPLLSFGSPQVGVWADRIECRFAILGGLLVARPGGSLVIVQRSAVEPELELAVAGYFPRLGGRGRSRSFRRVLYATLQARAHRAISRRFLERAACGSGV